MASFYEERRNLKKAEALYTEALNMRRRLFKNDNPDLATSINNMAILYQNRGKFKKLNLYTLKL